MGKKLIWKRLLIGFAWVICLGGLVVLMSFIETKKASVVCTAVKVNIPGNQYFIDKQEVDQILQTDSHTLIGKKLEISISRNWKISYGQIHLLSLPRFIPKWMAY
jgi:cell division protein FtsQ